MSIVNFLKNKLQFKNFNTKVIYPCLYIASVAILLFNPTEDLQVKSFNRIIGQGLMYGVDINKRMMNFFFWYLIIIPILIVFIYFLFGYLSDKYENSDCFDFLNSLSIASLSVSFLLFFNRFALEDNVLFGVSTQFSCITIITIFIYTFLYGRMPIISTNEKKSKTKQIKKSIYLSIPFDTLKWCIFVSFVLSFVAMVLLNSFHDSFFVLYIIILPLMIFSMECLFRSSAKKFAKRNSLLKASSMPIICSLIVLAVFLEFCNILNQYNIFIIDRLGFSRGICLFLIVIGFIIYCLKKIPDHFEWEKLSYPLIILGLCLFVSLPPLQSIAHSDLFEQANHGMLVYDFLKFGKIPLIESFDGHMLAISFWGILYGLLNQDVAGAVFIPYQSYMSSVLCVLSYFLLAKCFNKDFAFFTVLLLPVPLNISFGIISILALIHMIQKKTMSSYLLYWLSLVAIVVYELPVGLSYSVGTTMVLCVILLFNKKAVDIKKCFGVLGTVVGICFMLYLSICAVKSLNPISRALEFLGIIRSNVNWTYSGIGDPNIMAFGFAYALLPLIVIIVLLKIVCNYSVNPDTFSFESPEFIIVLSLFIAYFINFQRSLGRHSIAEMQIYLALWSAPLALAFIGCIFNQKSKREIFTIISLSFAIFVSLLYTNKIYNNSNLLTNYVGTYTNQQTFSEGANQRVERISMETMELMNDKIINTINTLMNDDETYMDLTNQTLLYALAGKEKPVYINQSPAHLSGEFTQVQFINQIEQMGDRVKFALLPFNQLPNNSDGLLYTYKYYKVYEYLSQNFVPLCAVDNFAIWCRKEQFQAQSEKLISIQENSAQDNIYLSFPLRLLDLTDVNFENGIMRTRNVLLFQNNKTNKDLIENCGAFIIGENKAIVDTIEFSNKYINVAVDVKGDIKAFMYPNDIESILPLDGSQEKNIISRLTQIDYDYADINYAHAYSLNEIPYIWGMFDDKKAFMNPVVIDFPITDNAIDIDMSKISKEKGNYLLIEASSSAQGQAVVTFGQKNNNDVASLFYFSFNLKEGSNNRYLIRVSSDFYWYTDKIDSFKITADIPLSNVSIKLLEGD